MLTPPKAEAAAQWLDLEIRPDKVPGDLTNYEVYVDLSDLGSDFWGTTNCTDIRIFQEGGTTELPREIVSCTDNGTTGTGELHFRDSGTLSSSATTTYEIHYDGTSSDYAVTDTYGRNNVWQDYDGVYHGDDTTDATGNGYTLTGGTGASSGDVNGKVGDTLTTSGVSTAAFTNLTFADYSTTTWSMQVWAKPDDASGRGLVMAVGDNNLSQSGVGLHQGRESTPNGNFDGDAWLGLKEGIIWWFSGTNISTARWDLHHLATDSSGHTRHYVNGSLGVTNTNTMNDPTDDLRIGAYGGGTSRYFDGSEDEIRISGTVVSADLAATEYNNMNDPSTFYWVSAEQTAGGGGGVPVQHDVIWFTGTLRESKMV